MADAKETPRRAQAATGIADPARYHEKFAKTAAEQIAKGEAPWQTKRAAGEPVLPRNAITDRRYTGGNAVYLAVRGKDRGFTDQRWVTARQLKDAGAKTTPRAVGERILYRDDSNTKQPVWRTATVYNVEQTRGLDLARRPPIPEWAGAQRADALLEKAGVPINKTSGDLSYYDAKSHQITMPARERFATQADYYSEALRQALHATGHPDRMNRKTFRTAHADGMDPKAVAPERLRTEMATMIAADRMGVGYTPAPDNGSAKLWSEALKQEPRAIHRAAAEAHRMVQSLVRTARDELHTINKKIRAEPKPTTPTHTRAPVRTGPAISPGR